MGNGFGQSSFARQYPPKPVVSGEGVALHFESLFKIDFGKLQLAFVAAYYPEHQSRRIVFGIALYSALDVVLGKHGLLLTIIIFAEEEVEFDVFRIEEDRLLKQPHSALGVPAGNCVYAF